MISANQNRKIIYENSYGFCGEMAMENKIFAYMRISTSYKTQKVDRQQQAIVEFSVKNGFKMDDFVSDVITGGTKADNRPNYHNMKKQFRQGDILIISDIALKLPIYMLPQ